MRFIEILVVFAITSIIRDAKGTLTFDFIRELIVPRKPELNRVRRIEDAHGDPLAVLDTAGLVEQYGYPAEEHRITTQDGYNIVFFRIPGSPKSPPTMGKPVVFMQHGVLSSSDFFVLLGPNYDLAFLLADGGYDVWLGNIRGNTYGRSHTNLTTLDKEFWNHSFHEFATIDIPSMIDYALKYSGEKKLFYIGHSMGTTISYILLSERPEYNEKMRLVVSFAASGVWKHEWNSLYRFFISNWDLIRNVTDSLRIYELAAQTKNNVRLFRTFCGDRSALQPVCLATYFMLFGQPIPRFNASFLSDAISYGPAGVSVKTLHHFRQCFKTGELQKYDLGDAENLRIYGTREPPAYDIAKVAAPVALFFGKTDTLSMPQSNIILSKLLPNVVTREVVPTPVFNHMDFLWSRRAKDVLYLRIIEVFSKYSK